MCLPISAVTTSTTEIYTLSLHDALPISANSERAFELLQNLVQERGKALLLATHNPAIAEACDWIHEMKDGLIIDSHPGSARSSIS